MDDYFIRPVDREAEMSKVMQRLMNHPLALHEPRAGMILSALRSKYCIETLTIGGRTLDSGGLDAMAFEARQAAKENASRQRGRIFDEADGIAIIPVWGSLTKSWGLDPWSGVTGYDGIVAKAIAASEDENIKGIWLDIDSGGGDVTGLKACTDVLAALSQRQGGKKPIYAMAAEHAYSAAYAIAVCADKVFVPEFGGVGSVGVITMHASFKRMHDEAGIDVTVIRSGDDKARNNAMEALPEKTREHIQRQVDVIRSWFVSHVSACMPGLSEKTVRETEGLDYMGEDARAIGFVSGVCSEVEAWGKLLRRINR